MERWRSKEHKSACSGSCTGPSCCLSRMHDRDHTLRGIISSCGSDFISRWLLCLVTGHHWKSFELYSHLYHIFVIIYTVFAWLDSVISIWYQSRTIFQSITWNRWEKLRSTSFAPKWIRRNIAIRLLLRILSIIITHALFFSDYLKSTTKITPQF